MAENMTAGQRCETCWFGADTGAIYIEIECCAPVPSSVNPTTRIKMQPHEGEDCPMWALKPTPHDQEAG